MALSVSQVQDYIVSLASEAQTGADMAHMLAEITGQPEDCMMAVHLSGVLEGLILALSLVADLPTVDMVKRVQPSYRAG